MESKDQLNPQTLKKMNALRNSKWNNPELLKAMDERFGKGWCIDYDLALANHFISIFEAGDKFEDAGLELGNHIDITDKVMSINPMNHHILVESCKAYGYYRNYAVKAIGGTPCDLNGKIFRLEKFFFWLQMMNQQETEYKDNPYYEQELLDSIHFRGCNTFELPMNMLFFLPEEDEIIILPKSQHIIKLNGMIVNEILEMSHKSLQEWGNKATQALLDVSKMIDDEYNDEINNE